MTRSSNHTRQSLGPFDDTEMWIPTPKMVRFTRPGRGSLEKQRSDKLEEEIADSKRRSEFYAEKRDHHHRQGQEAKERLSKLQQERQSLMDQAEEKRAAKIASANKMRRLREMELELERLDEIELELERLDEIELEEQRLDDYDDAEDHIHLEYQHKPFGLQQGNQQNANRRQRAINAIVLDGFAGSRQQFVDDFVTFCMYHYPPESSDWLSEQH